MSPIAATLRAGQDRPTSQPPTGYTAPAVDHVVEQADNIPYRGDVNHGVPAGHAVYNPELEPFDHDGQYVHYDPEPKHADPIPVYQVAAPGSGDVVHAFRTLYAAVGPNPVMLAGQHGGRTKLKIANRGTRTLYLGSDQSVSPLFGFPIPAGASQEINSAAAVYGVLDRITPNRAPAAAANPSNAADWTLAGGTGGIATAPWNPARTAVQLTATAAAYYAQTPNLGPVVAGQTVFYRFKVLAPASFPAVYLRPVDAAGFVGPTITTSASQIGNVSGWQEIIGSFIAARDSAGLSLRVGVSTGGAIGDVITVGDVQLADTDTGGFIDAGVLVDNQPVSLYEEFDVIGN